MAETSRGNNKLVAEQMFSSMEEEYTHS